MAITNADGSIILSTNVDTSGIKKGLGTLKKDASTITQEFKSLAAAIGLAFSVTKLVQFSKESAKLATQTEASVQRLIDIYGDASKEIGSFIDANARALGMSKASAASFASVYGNLFSVWADQQTNAQLTAHYLNATAVVASKTSRTMEDVQERIRSGLLGNTEAVEDLGIFVNVKTIEMTEAFQRVADGRSWEQLNNSEQSQVRTLAILEQATKKYGDEVSSTTALTRARFNAAYEDFKNTWGQVVNLVLIPVLNFLTKIFSVATALINNLMGKTGNITDETEQISGNIGVAVENQEALTDEVKNTEKALKKTLAGFDDLQILTSGASGSDSAASGGGAANVDLGELPEVASGAGNFDPMAYATKINEAIAAVLPYIEIGLVAIGLFLLACGNIPWGIGFIVGGAVLYSVTEGVYGEFDLGSAKTPLEELRAAIPPALVAIGIVLMFLGQIPWGIGFIITGAAVHGVSEVASAEFETATIEEKLAVLGEAVSLALVTIGVLLIFCGNLPLGLGFIVAGKALLDISEQTIGGDITTEIQKFFDDNKEIIMGAGIVLVVLGLLLLLTPASWMLALGLIAGGATVLVTESKINDRSMVDSLKEFINENADIITAISLGLLVIGLILLFVPASLPLALGLIAAGAVGLATSLFSNPEAVKGAIEEFVENINLIAAGAALAIGVLLCVFGHPVLGIGLIVLGASMIFTAPQLEEFDILGIISDVWDSIKSFWNTYVAPFFTAEWWLELGKTCINGLIGGFEGGINFIIGGFEDMLNWLIEQFNKISFTVPDWVPGIGGETVGVNLEYVDWGPFTIPRLAKGAVIPGGKEFLSILGDQPAGQTNIETPLDTMIEAFNKALDGRGDTVKEEHYYLSETELMSIVYKLVKGGERIQGTSLVNGGGY